MNPIMNMLGGMMGGGQSNPMMQLMQMMRGGGNPMQMIQQMAQNNPQMQQVLNSVQGKSPEQVREMAENLAKERGVKLEDVAKNLGISLPTGGVK